MAIALVGAVGTVSVGTAGSAVTPAFGTGESRTAGNLLVLQIAVTGSATVATVPSGWTSGVTRAGTSCSVAVFYRIATGADAAPTVAAITSGIINAQLSEYSGTDPNTAGVLGSSGVASGTTTPQKATNAAVDSTVGSLMVSAFALLRSSAGTLASDTATYTNGTAISTKNSATSTTSHYNFSYSLTTAKAVADADSQAFTATAVTGVAVALVTFRPPQILSPTGIASAETFGAATVVGGAPHLLAAYSFDEGTGTTATDASGNGRNATINLNGNAAGFTTGHTGTGLGNPISPTAVPAPYAVLPADPALRPARFTIMGWVSPVGTIDYTSNRVFLASDSGGNGVRFDAYYHGQTVYEAAVNAGIGGVRPATTVPDPALAHHMAVSYDGTAATLFIDGVVADSQPYSTAVGWDTGGLQINGVNGGGVAVSAWVDDWRFYDAALTAAQVTTCMNTPVKGNPDPLQPLSLLAAYSFDASNGTDVSGNGHTMTDIGGSTITTFASGAASVLSTAGGYATARFGVANQSVLMGPSFTFMAWVKWHTTDQGDGMLVIGPGAPGTGPENGGYRFYLTNAGQVGTFDERADSISFDVSPTLNVQDTFVHVAFSFDAASGTFTGFVNGASVGSHTGLAGAAAGLWGWGLHGHSSALSDPGVYDDVRLYNQALTAAQITTCMNTPVGTLADPLAAPPAQTVSSSGIGSGETFGTATVSVAGDGAQTLSPSGIASSETFGTVSLSTGPVSVASSGIVSGEVFGTATVQPGAIVLNLTAIGSAEAFGTATVQPGAIVLNLTAISSAETFGTATVQPGAVVLSPTAIGSAETFGAVTVQSAVALSPTAISSAEVFGTASISAGAVILSATAIGSAEAFGTAIVQSGVAAVSPTAIASAEAFGIATLVPGVTAVAPSAISSVETFGTATVQSGVTVLNVTAISSAEAFGTAVIQSGIAQLNVNGIASAEAFGALTVQAGPVSVAPASISSAEQLGTVDVQLNAYALRPTGISSAETFGTASITTGAITISVTSISSAESFGVTAIHTGAITLSAQSIDTAEALGIPAIQIGAASVSPLSIDSAEAFGTAFIALATQQTLNISSIDTAEQFGTVSMLGGLFFIEIDSILSEEAFGNSTVVLEPKKPFYFVGPNGEDLISVTPDDLAPLQDELNQFINIGQPDDTVSLTPIDMAPLQVALNQFNPVQAEAGYTVHWLVTPPMVALVGRSAGMVAK